MTKFALNNGSSVTLIVQKDAKILIAALDGSSGADLFVTADQADTVGMALIAAARVARKQGVIR